MIGRQRFVTKGAVKFSDRRIVDGLYLLIPRAKFRQVFFYWYAFYARKYQMSVHHLVLMSTHYHAEQTDTLGQYPNFTRDFHAKIAHEIHRMFGIKGPIWCRKSRGGVMDVASVQAHEKVHHYITTNPVEAGICANPEDWPGFAKPGEVFTAPEHALKKDASHSKATMPKTTIPKTLTLPMASCVAFEKDGYSAGELEALVKGGEQAAIDEVHHKRVQAGKSYQRVKHALKLPRLSSKRSRAAKAVLTAKRRVASRLVRGWQHQKRQQKQKGETNSKAEANKMKRGLTPRWVAVTKEAILMMKETLKAFRKAYLIAYQAFRSGNEAVEFPHGTWKMVHIHGCRCAPP